MAPRWGFPGLYSSSADISSTSLWIGLSKVDEGRLLFPFDARFRLPTSGFTFLTSPSSSGSASTTWHTLHWFLNDNDIIYLEIFPRFGPLLLFLKRREKFLFPPNRKFFFEVLNASPPFPWIEVGRLEYSWRREHNLCLQIKEVIWSQWFCGSWLCDAFRC